MFSLVAQRIVRNGNARQSFLTADSADLAQRLAQYQFSAEMLESAKSQADNAALRNKLTELIDAIAVARAASQ